MSTSINDDKKPPSAAAWAALRVLFGIQPGFHPTLSVTMYMPGLKVAEWLKRLDAALAAAAAVEKG